MPCVAWLVLLGILIAYTRASQPSAAPPQPAPLRELPWAQLNFLSTTDTHGWLAGHLQEPSYSADWGDYVSFAQHLRKRADQEGKDLLLIDSGDRVEGNGLYDSSDPKGKYIYDIFKHQDIDLLTCGNHELYKEATAENELHLTVPNFRGNYLASNVDVWNDETNKTQPLAARFKKFTTKNQGIRIISFGFLFNFKQNAGNSKVISIEDTIKSKWFQDAIHDRDVDLFVIVAHIGFLQKELYDLYATIRKVQWDTPIAIFGGHLHIRDFKKYDDTAWGIEAGRYLETIGFMSIDGLSTGGKQATSAKTATFKRRYIDNNLYSMYHHTGLNASTFPTAQGQNTSQEIEAVRRELNLDETLGCAPKTLWVSRVPFDDNDSIYKWLKDEVLPDIFKTHGNQTEPKMVLLNTGAIRFDIFQGPFTKDSQYLVSPFTSPFRRIAKLPYRLASQLLRILNNGDVRLDYATGSELVAAISEPGSMSPVSSSVEQGMFQSSRAKQQPLVAAKNLTQGYVTSDDAGKDGDDTEHDPVPNFPAPGSMQATIDIPDEGDKPASVDIIYNQFLEQSILRSLQFLGLDIRSVIIDTLFDGEPMTEQIVKWIQEHWKCTNDE